jgi:uroporphyrinogen decarboxylase
MRQAGRSLPEYREIRKRYDLFEVCRRPELCAEVTLQPVRAHGVDAAVMFADIMLPVLGMGVDVELVDNVGPVVARPIETAGDVERLRVLEPEDGVPFVLEAIGIVREELPPQQAVIGFAGGPFTVAGYLIEGGPTRDFLKTKACMYGAPEVWHALIDDYREFAARYSSRVLAAVDVPAIHFGTGTAHLLADMAAAGGDVIGLDWRLPIERGWKIVGPERGVQGNLDPALLLGPFERVEAASLRILDAVAGRRGHVFNLGHGVLPGTDPSDLRQIVELVHERTSVQVRA